jgi:hypothetical protein
MCPFFRSGRGLVAGSIFLAIVGYCGSGSDAKADLRRAEQAFESGDYERARTEWSSLADRGDPDAEFGLGEIYEQADGDYKRAEFWYDKAARHGNAQAKYRLALISMTGNDRVPPDLIKSYKWALLTGEGESVWAELGKDLRGRLESRMTAGQQVEGKKQADLWKTEHTPNLNPSPTIPAPPQAPKVEPPTQPPGSGLAFKNQTGCTPPGWPGPPLPCSDLLPQIPGQGPPPQSFRFTLPPELPALTTPPPKTPGVQPLDELTAALKRIDCASLKGTISPQGAAAISGTVPSPEEQTKLVQVATRLSGSTKPEVNVEIVPPPLCRALIEFDGMRLLGLASDGIGLRLISTGGRLREGDLIKVEVRAPGYPVYVRIDYFSLDGRVLHMWPNSDERVTPIAANKTRIFGDPQNGKTWEAGGAPFGIEFVAVTATAQTLDLGSRPDVENALSYLHDLESALRRLQTSTEKSSLVETTLVRTAAR